MLVEAVRMALHHGDADGARFYDLVRSARTGALVDLADRHAVLPLLHRAMEEIDGPVDPDLRSFASAGRHRAIRANLLALDGLRTLQHVLEDVPWLVVKGPVLSGIYYRRPDLRSFVDLDVVVPPSKLRVALEALESSGCSLADRNWSLVSARVPGQLRVMLPSGLWVDLHWHLLNGARLRSAFRVRTDRLFERSRDVALPGLSSPVRTLGVADTLVHVAVHACLSGADRLSWVADIHQVASDPHQRWSEVIEISEEQDVSLVVGSMLRRAERSLALNLPPGIVERLAPRSSWAAVTALVDGVSPVERCTGRPSIARMVLRSTRRTSMTSAAELLRRSAHWWGSGASRQPRTPDHDPSSPTSFLFESGGSRAREAYLAIVEAADHRGVALDDRRRRRR